MHSPKHKHILCDAGNRLGEEFGVFFLLLFFPTYMGVNKPSFKVTLTAMKLEVSKLEHKSPGTGSFPAIHILLDHIFK